MPFDYDAPDNPDAVLAVADQMRGVGRPKPLSEEQKLLLDLDREFRLEENRKWHEQRRIERAQAQAEAKAEAERQAALAAEAARKKAQDESRKRLAEQARDREIADLRFKTTQNSLWRVDLENAARNRIAYAQRQTLMNELEALVNPPVPSEPSSVTEVIYTSEDEAGSPNLGDPDFNPKLWTRARRWF